MRSEFRFPIWMMALACGAVITAAQETPTPQPGDNPPKPEDPVEPPAPKPAPVPAQNRFLEEQVRLIRTEMAALQEAYMVQARKLAAQDAELKAMRTANAELQRSLSLKFATNKDIEELATQLTQLDKNRMNDVKVLNGQIDKMLALIEKLAKAPVSQPRTPGNNPPPRNFKFREHKVEAGQFLSTILAAYNSAFKQEGLSGRVTQSQVIKANPGLNPNKLLIGQTVRIPLPGEIK